MYPPIYIIVILVDMQGNYVTFNLNCKSMHSSLKIWFWLHKNVLDSPTLTLLTRAVAKPNILFWHLFVRIGETFDFLSL